MDDLSDYERVRLENIRRNANFLASLGLEDTRATQKDKESESLVVKRTTSSAKKKPRKNGLVQRQQTPSRRSIRLMKFEEKLAHQELSQEFCEGDDHNSGMDCINYDNMPLESHQLDDHEFQIFALLRRWRLLKSRELDIEPYKICQNRTLCEFIRRKRNDERFASSQLSEEGLEESLLECWGIGPTKVKPGNFGRLINDNFAEEEIISHLQNSRKMSKMASFETLMNDIPFELVNQDNQVIQLRVGADTTGGNVIGSKRTLQAI
jgi:hypothetical protein